jgi:hypothetical protein
MPRLTFVVDEALAERIRLAARLRHLSLSDVIREKVAQGFEAEQDEDRFPFIGMIRSDGKWSAADLDEFLDETWADEIMRHRGK